MTNDPTLKDLVATVARYLVDKPEHVSVDEVVGEQTTVIELRVSKEDIGKIIGKQGRTAQSLRTLLNGAATKIGKRCVLEIIE